MTEPWQIQAPTTTRASWTHALQQFGPPLAQQLPRRRHPRRAPEFGVARLSCETGSNCVPFTARILDASAGGLMVKHHEPLAATTPVHAQILIADTLYHLSGHVVHATQTVGGYKIGIELSFAG